MFRCPECHEPNYERVGREGHCPDCHLWKAWPDWDRPVYRWVPEDFRLEGRPHPEVPPVEPEPEWTRRQWETVKRLEAMNRLTTPTIVV